MPSRIEDYAMIGDCQTGALVGLDGSIDWLCVPRFDSHACFAALLGTPEHGRWLLRPAGEVRKVSRDYHDGTLVLETLFETDEGSVAVIDFMPPRSEALDLVRIVQGRRGQVKMTMELVIRYDYGSIVPWVRKVDRGITAIAGPDMLTLRTDVPLHGRDFHTLAEFTVSEGQSIPFDLTYYPSHRDQPSELDAMASLEETRAWWKDWVGRCQTGDEWCEAVRRSLITLKALTYAPTGGIVAALTTSLPEHVGGVRNWDYRFCWLRDATFTLYSLMLAGYREEAAAWREWLLRAVAGNPSEMQIMYGLAGERRLTESTIPWLPGYEESSPVRIGNGAYTQHQLDVYGEVMDSLHQCRRFGLEHNHASWDLQRALMEFLETRWQQPDEGIWEIRSNPRQFTHSKVMAWVAFDRAVKGIEKFGLEGPTDRWRAIRDTIHAEVCEKGYNDKKASFVQSYGSNELDASLLTMPLVGFLPPNDPRIQGTIAAVQRELMTDGFVNRYSTDSGIDGLPPGEASFLLCTFWLADALAVSGQREEAKRVFDRVLDIRNDVGLLSEVYDAKSKRLLGNFPQAFSHVGLVNTAYNLMRDVTGPAEDRPTS